MFKASPSSEMPREYLLPYFPEPEVQPSALESLAMRISEFFQSIGSGIANFAQALKEHLMMQMGLKKQPLTPSEMSPEGSEPLLPVCQLIESPKTYSARLKMEEVPTYHAEMIIPDEEPKVEVVAKKIEDIPSVSIVKSAPVLSAVKLQKAQAQIIKKPSQKAMDQARQLAQLRSFGAKAEKWFKAYLHI